MRGKNNKNLFSEKHCMNSVLRRAWRSITNMSEALKRSATEVGNDEPTKKTKIEETSQQRKPKNQKYAILMSYNGAKYFGMQINGDRETIEERLFAAMAKMELITDEDACSAPSLFQFQRAARTDKRVSAIRQMCSAMLGISSSHFTSPISQRLSDEFIARLNSYLPDDIRVMGMKRAIKSFNAKNACDSRSYSYTMPTFALAPVTTVTDHTYRIPAEQLAEANHILGIFVGVHNFFNYTSGKLHHEMSCNRFIMNCSLGEPVEQSGWEMVTVNIKGQSFMLHQIRKMVGLTIAIMRGLCNKSIINTSWESERVDIPRAPGLGLLLEKVHYTTYDKKWGTSHEKLDDWPECDARIEEFRTLQIMQKIIEAEIAESSMIEWLGTLPLHRYERPAEDDPDQGLHLALNHVSKVTKEAESTVTESASTVVKDESTTVTTADEPTTVVKEDSYTTQADNRGRDDGKLAATA